MDSFISILSAAINIVDVGILIFNSQEQLVFCNDWINHHIDPGYKLQKEGSFSSVFPDMINGRIHNALKSALVLRYPSFISQSLNHSPFPLYHNQERVHIEEHRLSQSLYVMPIVTDNGEVFALIQISDVTDIVLREKILREQKIAAREAERQILVVNRALSESEERYRNLVQTIPDIVYKIDHEGKFIFINNAIQGLGYDPAALIGKHFSMHTACG